MQRPYIVALRVVIFLWRRHVKTYLSTSHYFPGEIRRMYHLYLMRRCGGFFAQHFPTQRTSGLARRASHCRNADKEHCRPRPKRPSVSGQPGGRGSGQLASIKLPHIDIRLRSTAVVGPSERHIQWMTAWPLLHERTDSCDCSVQRTVGIANDGIVGARKGSWLGSVDKKMRFSMKFNICSGII